MMKKGIICGVCAVAFLLFLTPTIPAQQYRLVNDAIEKEFQQHLDQALTALRNMLKEETQLEDQKKIVLESFNEIKQIVDLGCFDALPLGFKFLISTILSLIFALLGTLFGIVFGPILTVLVKVLTFPAVLLAKILAFLFDESKVLAL